jgi:hypothetical protein
VIEEEAPIIEEEAAAAVETVVTKGTDLVRNLETSGEIRQAGEAAHHIVAKASRFAEPARQVFQKVGIKVNDAVNGVNLPATKDYVGKAANHLFLHTKAYYEAVNQLLSNAETREQAIQALQWIKEGLLNGTFPPR